MSESSGARIAVVGGGAAGIGTLWYLMKAGVDPTTSITVFESKATTNGRVRTDPADPAFDYGAAYLGPAQEHIWDVLAELAGPTLTLDPSDTAGRQWLIANYFPPKSRTEWQGTASLNAQMLGENYPITSQCTDLINLIETLAVLMLPYVDAPYLFPLADRLDALTPLQAAEALLQQPLEPYTREILEVAVRSALSVENGDLSALYLIQYAATCGGFLEFENVNGTGDSHRLRAGMGGLLDLMRAKVQAYFPNLTWRVKEPVASVTPGSPVTLKVGGKHETFDHAVVAMSPALWPGLISGLADPARAALCQSMKSGLTQKVFLKFDKAWWRPAHTGYALSHRGPVDWLMDNCVESVQPGADGEFPVTTAALMCFIVGDKAVAFHDLAPEDQATQVKDHVGVLLGDPVAVKAGQYLCSDLPIYCPAAVFPPRALTSNPCDLRASQDNVYFAASELGRRWMGGYVNGAFDSAEYAANQLAAALSGKTLPSPEPTPAQVEQMQCLAAVASRMRGARLGDTVTALAKAVGLVLPQIPSRFLV